MLFDQNSRPLRFIIIDGDDGTRTNLRGHLVDRGFKVIAESGDFISGLRFMRGLDPDVVLLELPASASDSLEMVSATREVLPNTGIILSAHDPSPQLILSSMRAGANEFLPRPIDKAELDKAVAHLSKQSNRLAEVGRNHGTVLSVFSTKGGVGVTTVASNLAVSLAQADKKVVLLDLNFQMGDAILHLDLPIKYSIADAFREGSIDQASLRNIMSQHSTGVFFMSGANRPEDAADIDRNHIVELLGMLNTMFDYVVVDMGREVDDRAIEVFDLSDRVLLLTQLTFPAVRNTTLYLDLLRRLEIDMDKVLLMVNRYHKKYELSLEDLERTVGQQAFWVIPNDYKTVSAALDNGEPVVARAPRSKVSRNIDKLAETLCDTFAGNAAIENVPAVAS
jgi:pilus assembly protein CpaE